MEEITAARTAVRIFYNDRDISADIAPMLESFEYTDFGAAQVDDIGVTLRDPDGRWCSGWYPDAAARIRAEIVWTEGAVTRILPCGEFTVDAPTYAHPGRMTLKATSASVTTSLRRQTKARAWINATLGALAQKIGSEHGVQIVFSGPDTAPIAKVEQKDKSDLEFLLEACRREGYALKVESNRLVIYRWEDIDKQPPALTITRGSGLVLDWSFSEDSLDSYRACRLRYRHPDQGILTVEYVDPGAGDEGMTLVVREHCASQAEALRLAKARLELANRQRRSGDVTVYGDPRLASGVTVRISGWGQYDGIYTVDEAKHTVGSGYRTSLKMCKVIT